MQGQANHFFRYAPEKIPYGKQIDSPVSHVKLGFHVSVLVFNGAMHLLADTS
jgi:hypothetical protein